MAKAFGFASAGDIERVRAATRDFERRPKRKPRPGRRRTGESNRWELVRLTEALTGGGPAEVVIQDYDHDAEEWTDSDLEPVDLFGLTGAAADALVWVYFSPRSRRWELVGGGPDKVIGKLDGDLAEGGSATVSVWRAGVDTGENITAFDWLAKAGSSDIASGKKVVCALIDGVWYVIEAECP